MTSMKGFYTGERWKRHVQAQLAKAVTWVDVPCPTCGAGVDQGCLVFGRDTLMKIRLHPHKSRERAAELHRTQEKRGAE